MRRILRVALAFTLVLMTAGVDLSARQAPRDAPVIVPLVGAGVVSGRIVSAESPDRPVRRAVVTLTMAESGRAVRAFTEDNGTFAFRNLPAARYTLSVAKAAYVTTIYGARSRFIPGTTVALKDGQMADLGAIPLTRGAVITGTVFSPLGRPLANAYVSVVPVQAANGDIKSGGTGEVQSTPTDDRGIYRIAGLTPGMYVVQVNPLRSGEVRMTTDAEFQWASLSAGPVPPASRPAQYTPVFHPGAVDVSAATPVTVAGGEERAGVDVVMQLIATSRVTGRLIGPDGQPVARVPIRAMPAAQFESYSPFASFGTQAVGIAQPDGTFAIPGLTPGAYKLFAGAQLPMDPQPPGGPQIPRQVYWAMTDLRAAGADVEGVTLTLQPGLKVSGTTVFEHGAAPSPDDIARVRFTLAPLSGSFLQSMSQVPAADGTFTIEAVLPGPMRMLIQSSVSGWLPKSAMLNGKDLFDEPLDIRSDLSGLIVTFTNQLAQISGTLVDGTGQPASQFYITVFSAEQKFRTKDSRRTKVTKAASDGKYTFTNLPAGDYYLCALTEYDPAAAGDPEFFSQLIPGAIKITLGDGEKKTQDLKLK